jgi:predicted nucleotidyltransferase component of viral defense system
MILENSVQKIITDNTDKNPLYLRNLIKEELQNYILNFVYANKEYNNLIFTGGTCLRKVYGINRLSEDLDFDYLKEFDISAFGKEVESYFKSSIQYPNVQYSVSGNENTVYFKFPILKELGIYSQGTPADIFVRCDFSLEEKGGYTTDTNMITAGAFQFFVNSYDLSTMFANKLVTFMQRSFFKGNLQKTPFKGRDIYDLFWMVQLSSKSSFSLKINKNRLAALLGYMDVDRIKEQFREKVALIDAKYIYDDLLPLLDSKEILDGFMVSYKDYLPKYIDFVLS